MKRSFYVRALWDDEAKRYYSQSDIRGLHIETASLDEFEMVLQDVALDLVFSNHVTPEEMASIPLRELVPTILWERPRERAA